VILLQRLRLDAGLTPEQLGEEAGVSGMTIRRIEDGKPTRPATLKKLADRFEVRASELLVNGDREAV
jgi:transcriptional regulator with XRE-family HTH domain